ncbi:MAG: hypothetical protein GY822_16805 [Deltaproteobacteria bacterium]|nr:hypothetical protein [Deltaproteobacteria bacterium]
MTVDELTPQLPLFCPRCAAKGVCSCKRRPQLVWSRESSSDFEGIFLFISLFLFSISAYFGSVAYEEGRTLFMVIAVGIAVAGVVVGWMFYDGLHRVTWKFRAEDDSTRGQVQTMDYEVVTADWIFERTLELPLSIDAEDTVFFGNGADLPQELSLGGNQDGATAILATLFSLVANGSVVMRARVRSRRVLPQKGAVVEEPWEIMLLRKSGSGRTDLEREVLHSLSNGMLPLTALVRGLLRNRAACDLVLGQKSDGNLAGFIEAVNRNLTIASACLSNISKVL